MFVVGGLALVLVGAGFAIYRFTHPPSSPPEVTEIAAVPAPAAGGEEELAAAVVKEEPRPRPPREKAYAIPSRPGTAAPGTASGQTPAPQPLPATSVYSQQLLQKFTQLDPNQG